MWKQVEEEEEEEEGGGCCSGVALRNLDWMDGAVGDRSGEEEEEKDGGDWEYRCVSQGFENVAEKRQEGRTECV